MTAQPNFGDNFKAAIIGKVATYLGIPKKDISIKLHKESADIFHFDTESPVDKFMFFSSAVHSVATLELFFKPLRLKHSKLIDAWGHMADIAVEDRVLVFRFGKELWTMQEKPEYAGSGGIYAKPYLFQPFDKFLEDNVEKPEPLG